MIRFIFSFFGAIFSFVTLGIVMAYNVWFIIWPNQKKIIAGELDR